MPDLSSRRTTALEEWQNLENSTIPVIYFGMASCGRAAGAEEVRKAVEEALDENFLSARLVNVGCIGPCYLEPLMDIAMPGWARVSYGQMTPARAKKLVIAALRTVHLPWKMLLGHLNHWKIARQVTCRVSLTTPCSSSRCASFFEIAA